MSYISGTYGLKYYKELTNERGVVIRLEILKRSYNGYNAEIAKISGLNFFLQGAQDSADTPIVKTSLQFSVLDNPFEPGLDSDGDKSIGGHWVHFAGWSEFYTPDATLWLVKLYRDTRLMWSGYITPDSYHESLDAFGFVQVTVRDNIGHLQDFEFDLTPNTDGLVRVLDVVLGAMSKINLPLDVHLQDQPSYGTSGGELVAEGTMKGVRDLYVCASAFDGKDWYDALEELLLSVGWCIRFADNNAINIGPLRYLPCYGYEDEDSAPSEELQFLGRGSGTRTFDPAYREIIEKVDFGQKDKIEVNMQKLLDDTKKNSSTTAQFIIEYSNDYGHGWNSHSSAQDVTSSKSQATFWPTADQFFYEGGYNHLYPQDYVLQDDTESSEGDAARNYIFICANRGHTTGSGTSMQPVYDEINVTLMKMKVMSPALKFEAEFSEHPMCLYDNKLGTYPYNLKKIIYNVKYTSKDGNTVRYWNGYTWIQTDGVHNPNLTKEYDPLNEAGTTFGDEMTDCPDCGAYGTLEVKLVRIQYQAVGGIWTSGGFVYLLGYGCYARLRSFWIESKASKVMKSDTVRTVVNANNNVVCKRTPMFGCMPQSVGFAFARNYENAFFIYNSDGNPIAAPYNWLWDNQDQNALPFPAKIHQQLLMFHYTTQEVLEGQCRPINYMNNVHQTTGELRYDVNAIYKTKDHILMSVNHDMLTDRFVSAIARDYKRYNQLWTGNESQL